MENRIKSLFSICLMLISLSVNGGSMGDDNLKEKTVEKLRLASLWIIEDGVKIFSESGKDGLHRKLVDEWGVLLWVDPWIETKDYLAQFRIKARGVNYQILNMRRETIGDKIWEIWVVKIVAKPWSGEKNRSVFYVTTTDHKYGHRKIIEKSDQFISSFSVNNRSIAIPTDDLSVLYELEAWEFPDNYKDSDLRNKKVVMDALGNIKYEH